MKKSLFAVAAMSAVAGAAQAQSSVTVYGILDVGFINSNSSVTASAAPNTPALGANGYSINYPGNGTYANGNLKQTQSVLGQSAEQTSRLGFKGTEDLGGGTSAFFTAEFTLAPNEQTLSGNATGGLKNRQTFVGLKKNGMGDFAVGTQYTPIHVAMAKTDAGQQNNLTGSAIYTGQADSGVVGGVGGNQNAYTTRVSNALTLNSDVVAGFQGHALAILNNNNASSITGGSNNAPASGIATGGMTNTNGWGLGLDYTWNKLFVTANYQALKQLTSTTNYNSYNGGTGTGGSVSAAQLFANASSTIATGMTATGSPVNIQDNQTYVAATYDFGILKAYANWVSRKANDTANASIYQKRQAEQIGVRSFVTPNIEGWATAGVGTFTPYGVNQNSAHFNAWQLGSNYWLSKRTNLYAIYGQYAQATTAYNVYSTSGTATTGQSNMNVSNFALGVRHTF
ncbi:porin [Polynucleobacter sp. JS-JIR-5-A7]|uniref:porin n=1 Tax=Polynucleobacter sp. JS-JIR-5-A7 TaxID=1758395 RepID=UPI001BFD89F0|nr:porin [Polynucleobacter sp. JS-JIR-5-A7]QWE06763.1 porin [Polynucleobacter sp. JS-JIR-5-A7]